MAHNTKRSTDATNKKTRLTKTTLIKRIIALFETDPNYTGDAKHIFRAVGALNHTTKLLCVDILADLVADDFLALERGRYRLAHRSQSLIGTFQRKRNGRNTVLLDDGLPVLVFERNAMGAFNGDRVEITMLARRENHAREAEVVAILERAQDTFVGLIEVQKNYAFLITDGRAMANDIFVPKNKLRGALNGQKVLVRITEWPQAHKNAVGEVIDVLGNAGDNTAEMHAILAEYGLPYRYPKHVEEAAEKLDATITPEEVARREDMRHVLTMTIDPHDAKDFDDALSIRPLHQAGEPELWEVGVHIADVSHYVREGDTIDREARERATSVYLVDRTIPMLPERLCNFICSLRPNEDKLAYSTIFKMRPDGTVTDWRLVHTVIRSDRRFTYEEAQYILEANGEASPQDLALPGDHPAVVKTPEDTPVGEYAQEIIMLNRLAKQLREQRFKHGAIGFDREEVRFDIDENGKPIRTYIKVAKDANKLVEEFMLLANRSVAELIAKPGRGRKPKVLPYRIHDVPQPEKLEKLQGFIAKFGYKLRTEGAKTDISRSINRLLSDVHGKPEQELVELVALRAMQKAKYSTDNIGHYGLMFDYYTHFTSPIRRYPDTIVHRLLTRYADGGRSVNKEKCEALCEHSSDMEQIAAQAERASIKYKQVEYMADRLGQVFEGKVSGVTEFGLYVETLESRCEGMIPLRDLQDDYYEFDEKNYALVGRRFKRRYALGDVVRIEVARADLDRRILDYALVDERGNTIKSHSEPHSIPIAYQSKPSKGRPSSKSQGSHKKQSRSRNKR